MVGTIKKVLIGNGKDYGFITVPNQKDVFFHMRQVAKGVIFEDLQAGDEVEFDMREAEKGLVGVNVRPVNAKNYSDEDLGL